MADLKDGERDVALAGKTRTLRMDFNALARAEVLTGRNYLAQETWRTLNTRDYRALAFGCFVSGGDEELTIDEVGSWMNPSDEAATAEVMSAILDLWFGKPQQSPVVDDTETQTVPLATAGATGGP